MRRLALSPLVRRRLQPLPVGRRRPLTTAPPPSSTSSGGTPPPPGASQAGTSGGGGGQGGSPRPVPPPPRKGPKVVRRTCVVGWKDGRIDLCSFVVPRPKPPAGVRSTRPHKHFNRIHPLIDPTLLVNGTYYAACDVDKPGPDGSDGGGAGVLLPGGEGAEAAGRCVILLGGWLGVSMDG